jgi:8-oxo-dGTP pyrophosphatase MutT (NUDIX family)
MLAAQRELAEEVGLAGEPIAYLGTWMEAYGEPAPDGLQEHVAISVYLTRLLDPRAAMTLQREEVVDARWFGLGELPDPLASPDHLVRVLALARDALAEPDGLRDLPDRIW